MQLDLGEPAYGGDPFFEVQSKLETLIRLMRLLRAGGHGTAEGLVSSYDGTRAVGSWRII